MSQITIPRIVIAGTGSGVGKTTIVLGLIQALQVRGLKVASFKCGPDYLDPTYHLLASNRVCHNLDSWMMGKEAVLSTFEKGSQGADIAIIEGVMGLFDGLSPTCNTGSTAEISQWLGAPILLVIDAQGMARTIAAIAKGFCEFAPELNIAGIISNFVGSKSHIQLLKQALSIPPIIGGLPKCFEQAFPERHLGLVRATSETIPVQKLKFWGDLCSSWLDVDLIEEIAKSAQFIVTNEVISQSEKQLQIKMKSCKIGVAWDNAFHFYYPDNLSRLESLGAELVFFSPLQDKVLPQVDGLYLGGGYPEAHCIELFSNESLREQIRSFGIAGYPIYAECGGLMYLSQGIITLEEKEFPMVGLIPGKAKMGSKLMALGYVEVTTEAKTFFGEAGLRFRGHQFRYSELIFDNNEPIGHEKISLTYRVRKRRGKDTFLEGYSHKNIIASYIHAHWASNPAVAEAFVQSCQNGLGKAKYS